MEASPELPAIVASFVEASMETLAVFIIGE